jgi:hypothetical protein
MGQAVWESYNSYIYMTYIILYVSGVGTPENKKWWQTNI